MKNIEQTCYIKVRALLKISAVDIHNELVEAYKEDALSYRQVARLVSDFKDGRESVEDRPHSGRPVTTFTQVNIDRVRDVLDSNPYATYDEIVEETSICRGIVFKIIHEALKLRKIASRYVPHVLSDDNKKKRVEFCQENLSYYRDGPGRLCDILTCDEVQIYHMQLGRKQSNMSWVGKGESPRVIVRRGNFDAKTLFSIFIRTSGPVLVHAVERGDTIDHSYYIENCLSPALMVIREQRPASGTKRIGLLHDNARPHVHSNVRNFLEENGIKLIKHPPYSPDLAPCDFWLFDLIKCQLGYQPDQKSLVKAVTKIVQDIPLKEYKKTFDKWIERMELCVKNNGDYFEHLIK